MNNIKSINENNKDIIYIERNYNYRDFFGSRDKRYRRSIILIPIIIILIIYSLLNADIFKELYHMIAFIFGLSILFFISCAFFLINGADLIVYKYGINFPRLYFIIKRKVKLLNCSDIKKISIDTKNKSLVIELKSGKIYNYNNSSYYKTDHLFPILKDAFNEYEHIEFVS